MAETYTITSTTTDGRHVVTLAGEFDLAARADLERALAEAVAGPGRAAVVVDLAQVRLLDSTTVAVLVAAHQDAARQATDLTVVNPRGLVTQVLKMTGVYDTLVGAPG